MTRKRWYQTIYFKIFLHLLAWTAFVLLPILLRQTTENSANRPPRPRSYSFELIMLVNLVNIGFFYFNAYVLMPALLNKKKLASYIVATIVSMTATAFLLYYLRVTLTGGNFVWRFPIYSFFNLLFFLGISITYRFVLDKNRYEQLQREKETETLKTELSFLRSQVSPHFMFNVLNNIVSLSRVQKDLVEPALIQLSELLRYMLYESDEDKVTLSREIEYLLNYINLQKMRFGDDIEVRFHTEGEFDEYAIEPMLFIPFVENAFKHGIGWIQNPFIDISIREQNGTVRFRVKNRFNNETQEVKDKNSGIGLNNVKRRLNLLYPGKHSLTMHSDNDEYVVDLTLELK